MKKINLPFDTSERKKALDPRHSFIVQAPAGSGKTELLTQRFLVLLGHVTQPEEILAITFTKKSAAEMRSRIIKALKSALNDPEPTAPHAKETWDLAQKAMAKNNLHNWDLLANPNRLQIQTIDSFNSGLTRQLPLLSHFGAPMEIENNPHVLYQEAVQEFLSHLEENVAWVNAIEKLLVHMDNDLTNVEKLLIQMLAKRDQWLPYIASNKSNPELRKTLEKHLSTLIIDTLKKLVSNFPQDEIPQLIALCHSSAEHLQLENPHSSILHCKSLSTLPGATLQDINAWKGIAELLLTKENTWRKTVNKKLGFPAPSDTKNLAIKNQFSEMKQSMLVLLKKLEDQDELLFSLIELNFLPNAVYDEAQWETLQALHDILLIAVAQLKIIFQQHGKIDFIENALGALEALGTADAPTDTTLALDYKIHHILIDEFQDTSNSQYRLLEKLISGWEPNDGRTLFVVGDPMQSIYRFREAEVGLFIRARKNGIGHLKLIPLTLSVNFRSAPEIVSWINSHFSIVLPPFEDMTNGAISYSPSESNQEKNAEASVSLYPFLNGENTSQAKAIVELIQKSKKAYPHEKIAILVRARTHLKMIIPALNDARIPFKATEIDPLLTRPVIQDLLALTKALNYPADKVAWLSILRAPWCGLLLEDLFKIAHDKNKLIIWKQLQRPDIISSLTPDGQERLQRIKPILEQAIAERRRWPLRLWIESTWMTLGGPACIRNENDLQDVNAYFELLSSLDESGYLSNIKKLHEGMNKLFAITDNQADDSLQIMTIHNAKGLEFDTVILPHLERAASADGQQLLQWMERPGSDESTALVLAPIHAVGEEKNVIYDYIKRQHYQKMQYENGRLLYVASTRAKKQLHLLFNVNESKNNEIKRPVTNSLLEKLWQAIEENVIHGEKIQPNITETTEKTAIQQIKRLITPWHNPIDKNYFQTASGYHQKKSGFILPDHNPKYIGTLIHQILQQISLHGVAWWNNSSSLVRSNYIKNHLASVGMQKKDIDHAVQMIEKAIFNTLNDPRGQWILQNHGHAQSEFALTSKSNEKVKNFVIDRTFVDESGCRWIIDYKAAVFATADLESFLLAQQAEYEQQLWEYQCALKTLEDRSIKVGLYFPLIPAWREWVFS